MTVVALVGHDATVGGREKDVAVANDPVVWLSPADVHPAGRVVNLDGVKIGMAGAPQLAVQQKDPVDVAVMRLRARHLPPILAVDVPLVLEADTVDLLPIAVKDFDAVHAR